MIESELQVAAGRHPRVWIAIDQLIGRRSSDATSSLTERHVRSVYPPYVVRSSQELTGETMAAEEPPSDAKVLQRGASKALAKDNSRTDLRALPVIFIRLRPL